MLTLTPSNTVYTPSVAKVMISMPDDLLERLDSRAKELGETRSGLLQRLVERELEFGADREDDEVGRLMESIKLDFGGIDAAQVIREERESH